MMTDEEKILGMEEKPKKKLDTLALTDACMYEVSTVGKENKSVENGTLIDRILPLMYKQRFINGEMEVNYNGMVIKRLTGSLVQPVAEVIPEAEPLKVEEEKPVKKTVKKAVKKTIRKKASK